MHLLTCFMVLLTAFVWANKGLILLQSILDHMIAIFLNFRFTNGQVDIKENLLGFFTKSFSKLHKHFPHLMLILFPVQRLQAIYLYPKTGITC
eukprot:Gb_13024 [translate_table: standard]